MMMSFLSKAGNRVSSRVLSGQISACLMIVAMSVVGALTMVTTTAAYSDRVLVIVNDEVITQSQFDYRLKTVMEDIRASNTPVPPNLVQQLLDGMISDRLQVQEAKRRGIEVSDDELNSAIERFATQQDFTVPQLRASLRASGQPFSLFAESVRDSIVISRFTDYYARRRVVVPDYEIDAWLAANNLDQDNSEYRVAHILIKDPEANAELAEQVYAELQNGLSFQQAVLTYSEATDAQEGGEIGWRTPAQLPSIFADALKGMQAGEVSPVLTSANGLHILKLLDRKGDQVEIVQSKVRHILIKAESQVARSQAAKRLFELRQRIAAGEDFADLARVYSDDIVSAATGGDLGWVSPGEMVPQFEQAFQQMPINEVSQPIQTQFGAHILRVEDRRKQNITDQLKRNRADSILRRQRADREYKQWVRELLEGAYVERLAEPEVAQR